MIISRTPFRISFFGGGTDYPAWYRQHGGEVLAATVNKYCYINARYLPPFFEHRIRVVYSRTESCQTVDEIQHPSVREVLRYLGIDRGVEIHHDGDLPARGGVGSSSAFTVGLLHALYALKGTIPSKHQLAMESIYLEQERLKETVGSQDQVMAAYGGLQHVTFMPSGKITVRPMTLAPARIDELESHLMLFFTGLQRTASGIASTYVHDLERKEAQLRRMIEMVDEAVAILNGSDITRFGSLLNEAWRMKKSLSESISNSYVDELYDAAIAAGALGGKLTGAGGGGFLLLFVRPADQPRVRERLRGLIHVPIQFDHAGSQIIFYEPEEDFASAEQQRAVQPVRAFQEVGPPTPWPAGPAIRVAV